MYSSLVKWVENFWATTEITLKSEDENAFIYLMVRAMYIFKKKVALSC